MQLVIDIGNTRVKAAIFDGSEILSTFIFNDTKELLAAGIIENHGLKSCIVASVVNDMEELIIRLRLKLNVLMFNSQTPVPVVNLYKSPQTLGSDRLAAAVGANLLFRNKDVLVIDCGTCIKYDFVNSKNEYIGGAISPGVQMRFKAMHTFTARLPLLTVNDNYDALIGTNSEESMLSGAQNGSIQEIDGFINQYKQQYPGIYVVLTGGDVNFFEKRLKNSIFADQNLILKGLNEILDHNLNFTK